MNWNCTITEERLSDYLEGTLAAEEREACAAHSAGCAKCAGMLASVGALVGQMHALEPLREPAFLARRIIHSTTRTQSQRHELASVTGWFSLIWQPRFAMGIATVVATFMILAHAAGAQISRLRPNDLNPVNWARAGNRQAHLTYARGEKFVDDLRVVYEIRAMLAYPQAAPAQPENQSKPNPDTARPDTGDHHESRFRRDVRIQNPRSTSDVLAMLNLELQKSAPDSVNRRLL